MAVLWTYLKVKGRKLANSPTLGFEALHPAVATIAGIEATQLIQKGPIPSDYTSAYQIFSDLTACSQHNGTRWRGRSIMIRILRQNPLVARDLYARGKNS